MSFTKRLLSLFLVFASAACVMAWAGYRVDRLDVGLSFLATYFPTGPDSGPLYGAAAALFLAFVVYPTPEWVAEPSSKRGARRSMHRLVRYSRH